MDSFVYLNEVFGKAKEYSDEFSENSIVFSSEIFDLSTIGQEQQDFYFDFIELEANSPIYEIKIIEVNSGIEFPYLGQERDFYLSDNLSFLCEQHGSKFQELFEQQEYDIEPFERYKTLLELHECKQCNCLFKLRFRINKERFLTHWFSQNEIIADLRQTDVFLWSEFESYKKHFNLIQLLKKKPKVQLNLLVNENRNYIGGYIYFIGILSSLNTVQIVKDSMDSLKLKKLELERIIEKQIKLSKKTSDIQYYPPEYWLEENTLNLDQFSDAKKELTETYIGFLISIFQVIADRTSCVDNKLVFVLDREVRVTAVLEQVGGQGWYINSNAIQQTIEYERLLLSFYERCIYSKYVESNIKLLRNAIILAGDESLDSIVTGTNRLIRYYTYQHENLMNEKLKEQSEVVKSLISATQALKSKLIQSIDDINKNVTSVVTVLLGIILTYVTIYGRGNTNGQEFILAVTILFTLAYLPLHIYRIINLVEMGNKTLTEFYSDIAIIHKIYDYDFQDMIKVQEGNKVTEKKLKLSAGITSLILLVINVSTVLTANTLINDKYANTSLVQYLDKETLFSIYHTLLAIFWFSLIIYASLQLRPIKLHRKNS